ncbi:hypothetical protein ANCDUO_06588, partial [Ancylostoma duodenale]
KTDNNKRVVAQTAQETYQELLSFLLTSNGQEKFTSSLSAEIAASGNELEIAKFLAVLLNEFRIAKADVITASVAVMEDRGYDLPLREILDAFDEEQNEWWSVMVIRSPSTSPADRTLQFVTPRRPIYQAEEFTGMSVNRASFITPRCPSRRSESNAHTVARCDGSPLMEALNSPKASRNFESERNNLTRLLDELKKAAESEREQYQAAISDCRKRYDDEISKNMALYSEEMEKNAVLQRETRDKSEIIEELQRKYEDDKSALQRSFDDLKKSSQEKCEILTRRLNETQAELRNLQERNRNMNQEHGEALRQLESVHLAETEQQNAQLTAARAHILKLEEELAKRDQAILDHRKEYARLTAEKDALEVVHKKAMAEMKMKDNELDEARRLIEKSSTEMESLKMKHLEAMRSFESLQAETAKLESSMQEKEAKLIELHKSVEELKTLKEAYSETSEALKNAREDHESQKKQFEQVEFGMLETIEDLKLKSSSRELSESISALKEELEAAQAEEARLNDDCEKLREKDSLRSQQLFDLKEKLQFIENSINFCNERSSKLEAENLSLKELIEMYDMAFMQSTRAEKRKSLCWGSDYGCRDGAADYEPSVLRRLRRISARSPPLLKNSTQTSSTHRGRSRRSKRSRSRQFTTSLDEPSMMETRSLLGPSDAIEVPAPSAFDDKDFLLKKIVQKCDAATSVSDLALISSTQAASESNLTSVVTGSDLSLATTTVSQGRQSFARSEFSRPSISGLSPQLKTTGFRMLPPSMRCAYATEVLGYGSPSGSENIVKHGTQSTRRKGKKLMERAASYVKKKLPLSESTNSIQ